MFFSSSQKNPGHFGQKRREGFIVKVKIEREVVSEMDYRLGIAGVVSQEYLG